MLLSMYDASLGQFKPHSWTVPDIWPVYDGTLLWNSNMNFSAISSEQKWINESNYRTFQKQYDAFIFNNRSGRMYKFSSPRIVKDEELISDAAIADSSVSTRLPGRVAGIRTDVRNASLNEVVVAGYSTPKKQNTTSNPQEVQVRKNFNETAFFFPQLTTDSSGAVEFSFSVPEAVTRWKLQALAHTKELSFGVSQKDIVTQKLLMVQTNAPRFLRQGDRIELSTKIVNLSGKEITGQAELQLLDATTNQSVDGWFQNLYANQYFTVGAGQSEVVKFPIEIPFLYSKPLLWRIVARSTDSAANIVQNSFSDGEEAIIPILTNKVLITETLPLVVKGNGTKNFTFEPLLKSGNNEQLQNHSLTFEYTANAAWYAVQALPYLTEPTNECAEQIWNRYDANSIAAMLTQTSPRLKQVFEKWKTADTASLLSNLQKNEELKSVLLQETPWVLQAKTEAQQKKNIALLFDIMHMNTALKSNLEKLQALQSENGGFVWFAGSPDDRYITQYILTGIGHLKKLNAIAKDQKSTLEVITQKALSYLDEKIKKDYDNLVAHKTDLKKVNGTAITIQYLYMRSFFPELPIPKNAQTAYNYFRRQAQQYWTKENKYLQGMIALALYRNGDAQTPKAILRSLKETSINTEMGMYWKENAFGRSWYWWQAPIETQALLIEAFNEISNDTKTVDALKTWLLKNKQTNNWRTTKATADACYALLLQGSNWIDSQPVVTIKAGSLAMSNSQEAEAGTGYFKQTLEGSFIKSDMGNISVTVQQNNSSAQGWGAAYWQYFEDMNSIKSAATPLQLTKKLFVEKNEDNGPVLHLVNEGDAVHIGDKIMVRIELRADRDMEYVHMKDLRASALEPVNVLSNYKWQGGLGYYESTKDASTDFFFNYLRKGTYFFEYPLFVTHAGSFSNGITTIQCLYAPEFSAHSDGVKLTVE